MGKSNNRMRLIWFIGNFNNSMRLIWFIYNRIKLNMIYLVIQVEVEWLRLGNVMQIIQKSNKNRSALRKNNMWI